MSLDVALEKLLEGRWRACDLALTLDELVRPFTTWWMTKPTNLELDIELKYCNCGCPLMGDAFQAQSLMTPIGTLDGLNPMPLISPVKMSQRIALQFWCIAMACLILRIL